ncbi:MAG: hypothetical protein KC505_02665 [Myxococcales bacterium]|nr:hypothetical protein [Myxococcales bacterium]USN50267.1 MAG: hypothetical protein H6731_08340 [Myxococcales bacterium]
MYYIAIIIFSLNALSVHYKYDPHCIRLHQKQENFTAYYKYQRLKQAKINNHYVMLDEVAFKEATTIEEIDDALYEIDERVHNNWHEFKCDQIYFCKKNSKKYIEYIIDEKNYYLRLYCGKIKTYAATLIRYAKENNLSVFINVSAFKERIRQKYFHFDQLIQVEEREQDHNKDTIIFFY